MGREGELKRKSAGDGMIKKKKKKIQKENVNCSSEENTIEKFNSNSSIVSQDSEQSVFSSLKGKISENTLKAIEDMGFTPMTKIQALSISPLLEGKDLVGTANIDSKKNRAFLIHAVELMDKIKIKPRNGTGCIIISPTRESALQTFCLLKELLKYHHYTCCLLTEGSDKKTEARKLSRGANILVATPERLLYHLQNTPHFVYKNLQSLVLDEADRILEIGSEDDLKHIINILPTKRQTVLFLNESNKAEALVTLAMKNDPVYVNEDEREEKTVEGLEEGYVLAQSDKRFHFLLSFLEKNKKKKVIVLFNSSMSTKYHHELLTYLDVPVLSIHGKQKQAKRTKTFSEFCTASSGILLCAEAAATEIMFPAVDWILQYEPPENPKEHIRRLCEIVETGNKGKAVLILSPEELGFLSYLKEARVSTSDCQISWNKIKNVQLSLEKLISSNYFLHLSAKEAFKAFVKSYDSHHLKHIFDVKTLDLTKVAKSFGFTVPPAIDLSITEKEFDKSARPEKRLGGGGYGFFKTMNNSTGKKERSKIFKRVGKRKNVHQISR